MQMPVSYQVPDDPDAGRMDAAYLRTCLGLPTPLSGEPPQLPPAVRRAHFQMSHALSRLGALGRSGMDATQIATVVALAALQNEEDPARTFLDDVEDGLVGEGDKVIVRQRGKDQAAHFLRADGEVVIVLHNGSERSFAVASVRLPRADEFPLISDNLHQPA
jgi:hypothetical protein